MRRLERELRDRTEEEARSPQASQEVREAQEAASPGHVARAVFPFISPPACLILGGRAGCVGCSMFPCRCGTLSLKDAQRRKENKADRASNQGEDRHTIVELPRGHVELRIEQRRHNTEGVAERKGRCSHGSDHVRVGWESDEVVG